MTGGGALLGKSDRRRAEGARDEGGKPGVEKGGWRVGGRRRRGNSWG